MGRKLSTAHKKVEKLFNLATKKTNELLLLTLESETAHHRVAVANAQFNGIKAQYQKALSELEQEAHTIDPERPSINGVQLTDEEVELAKTNKIQAIKAVRERANRGKDSYSPSYFGLKDAKDLVDKTVPSAQFAAAYRGEHQY